MAFKRKTIKSQQTVGSRLKTARKKLELTLEQAEEATKVRIKYLKAIEADNWSEFPSRIYVYGFVKRYADFLELDSEKVLEEFKSEFGQNKVSFISKGTNSFFDKIVVTPKFLIWTAVILVVGFLIGFIIVSTQQISKPPEIEIISPKEDVINVKDIVIEGKTLDTAVVEINGQLVNVDDKGYFQQKTALTEGINIFDIKSKSRVGKEQTKTIKILFSPTAPTATVTTTVK